MSGALKAVGKVFKKTVKAVGKVAKGVVSFAKKIYKPLLIAAAVYFTVGVAAGAFGGASAISSLPGWGAEGLFSQAAVAVGAPGFAAPAAAGVAAPAVAGAAAPAAAGGAAGFTGTALHAAQAAAPVAAGAGGTAAGFTGNAVHAAMGAGDTVGGGGIIGSAIKGVGGFVKDNPVVAMMLGQGAASAAEAYQARKLADEERKYQIKVENEAGFFGMDKLGTQIDLPTVSGMDREKLLAPPQVAPPQVQMTQQQLLEAQRNSNIRNPGA